MIKSYQKYILKNYLKSLFNITAIFFILILILNIFEEISYFKDSGVKLYIPLLLNFLNAPSILYNIFPFIFLISSQYFFLNLIEKNELIIFKSIGLENLKLINFLSLISLMTGVLIILLFYNISSKLKFVYLDLKNDYASDNKYLAVINENGLWIRDEMNGSINIISAEKIEKKFLKNVVITQFDKDFNLNKYIYSKIIDAENNSWFIESAKITKSGVRSFTKNNFFFETNFTSEKINNLFSNLESFTLWNLYKLRKDYSEIGYSTSDIDIHLQKLYSFPIYVTIMTILSAVIMLNIKHNKPKGFYLLLGIILSVLIFYINHLANILGESNKLPINLSIWLPHILLSFIIGIGLVRINEK
jgi:lipopolysaccharide export system permease protein